MGGGNLGIHNLFNLEGKTALVTGGSRGIGYMIAQGLLQAGARVYITARKAEACLKAAEELSQFGECRGIPGNIVDEDSRRELCRQLEADAEKVHILVNNAGMAWGAPYEDYPQSAFDRVMATNVSAMFCLTRDLTPLLAASGSERDPARVINIGSMEALHIPSVHDNPVYAYTASKAAVNHLTRHLAVDLAKKHITVNAIAPGYFPSKMTDHVFGHALTAIEHNCLLGRVGEPEEMAGIAIYLSSRAGAYTNGTVIPVDGGTSINQQHASTAEPEG